MGDIAAHPLTVLEGLLTAVNDHDVEGLAACFAESYVNETPAHPGRGFTGREQVRRNWRQIFERVPDVHAHVVRTALQGRALWTEWEMSGTRADALDFLMRGVIIFEVTGSLITSARFYLEPVEDTTGDVNQAVRRVVGNTADHHSKETS